MEMVTIFRGSSLGDTVYFEVEDDPRQADWMFAVQRLLPFQIEQIAHSKNEHDWIVMAISMAVSGSSRFLGVRCVEPEDYEDDGRRWDVILDKTLCDQAIEAVLEINPELRFKEVIIQNGFLPGDKK